MRILLGLLWCLGSGLLEKLSGIKKSPPEDLSRAENQEEILLFV